VFLTELYLGPLRRLANAGIVSIFGAGDDGVNIDADATLKFPAVLQTELKLTIISAIRTFGECAVQQATNCPVSPTSNFGPSSTDFAVFDGRFRQSTAPVLGDAVTPSNKYEASYRGAYAYVKHLNENPETSWRLCVVHWAHAAHVGSSRVAKL
jgi:hypothetical protein